MLVFIGVLLLTEQDVGLPGFRLLLPVAAENPCRSTGLQIGPLSNLFHEVVAGVGLNVLQCNASFVRSINWMLRFSEAPKSQSRLGPSHGKGAMAHVRRMVAVVGLCPTPMR